MEILNNRMSRIRHSILNVNIVGLKVPLWPYLYPGVNTFSELGLSYPNYISDRLSIVKVSSEVNVT